MTGSALPFATRCAALVLACGVPACSEDSSATTTGAGAGGAAGSGAASSGGGAGSSGSGGVGGPPSCDGTPTPAGDPKLAKVIQALHEQLDPVTAPGGALAIIIDGQLAHVAVAGSKTSGKCDPITASTLFRVGLLTEAVTSMAALDLVEKKKLSLTAPITDVVPGFKVAPGKALEQDVTLAHLLAQTSGYAALALGEFSCSTLSDSIGLASVPLWCAPGTMSIWDPSNFAVAGLAVETVSKKPFAAAARQVVLEPLKMGGTFEPTEAVKLDHSLGHQRNGFEQKLTQKDCADQHASTQYHASIQDMGKLAAALLSGGGGVLDPATVADMFADHGQAHSNGHHQGYGVTGYAPLGAVYLGGESAGFRSDMVLFPEQKLGVVTLLNGAGGAAEAVNDVFSSVYSVPPAIWPPKTYAPVLADLESVQGEYEDDLGFKGISKRTLSVKLNGAVLEAVLKSDSTTEEKLTLGPTFGKDNFEIYEGGEAYGLRFWRDPADKVFAASIHWSGGPPFYRVTP